MTDQELLDRFPGVLIDAENRAYYEGLLDRRLLIKRCSGCGYWIHPQHRPICPRCWSDAPVPTEVSGRGSVYMVTLLHQGRTIPGVDYSVPHPVAAVELAEQEGLRYLATIVDCPLDRIEIGMPVELTWTECAGVPCVAFRPADERGAGAGP